MLGGRSGIVNTLAIETSGRVGSIAVLRDGCVLGEKTIEHGLKHAAAIVPAMDGLLSELGMSARDVGRVCVGQGPGSFTGLRVGITIAKMLSMTLGVEVVGVPSGDVLAENLPNEARLGMTLLDAKRGQVFAGLYEREGGVWRVLRVPALTRIETMLACAGGPIFVIGEGIAMHREALERMGARDCDDQGLAAREADEPGEDREKLAGVVGGVWLCPEWMWRCRASVVGRLGDDRARRGVASDAWGLEPLYVRRAEAEEKRLIAAGLLNADGTERD